MRMEINMTNRRHSFWFCSRKKRLYLNYFRHGKRQQQIPCAFTVIGLLKANYSWSKPRPQSQVQIQNSTVLVSLPPFFFLFTTPSHTSARESQDCIQTNDLNTDLCYLYFFYVQLLLRSCAK